jgi:hypothetical protein
VQAGYAFLSLDGAVGYDNDQNAIAIEQDTKEAFGLGDVQGSPYVRAQLDLGIPVLTVSGFQFSDEGRGRLAEDFGSLPNINGGLPVQTGFDMFNAKVSYAFDIGIGPVAISPGIAIDYFDLQMDVQDAFGLAQESVDLNGPVPLGFLRASLDLEIVSAFAEVGYIGADVSDIKGTAGAASGGLGGTVRRLPLPQPAARWRGGQRPHRHRPDDLRLLRRWRHPLLSAAALTAS